MTPEQKIELLELKDKIRKNPELSEAMGELFEELNGKVMNYSTCRMLEEFFYDYMNNTIDKVADFLDKTMEKK